MEQRKRDILSINKKEKERLWNTLFRNHEESERKVCEREVK